ncbi:MAG: histidine phosphatase family protein, partial [Candidatus Eremiobacteraeota bacterium]|nr:histidine phosphatase family protein [Candidatus Eremiobacteraeota bacterium]
YPQEALLRARLGKFYYRPPRGESWADVVLRLRSVLETIRSEYAGERVLIVTHQVVILCLRYILEGLSELQLLEVDRAAEVANCSLTAYAGTPGDDAMRLLTYNFVAPLEKEGAPVTSSPDAAKT